MTKSFAVATAAFLTAAVPVAGIAETVTLTVPAAAQTLRGDAVDMAVYFVEGQEGALDVVATYVTDDAPGRPNHLVMQLADGDDVSFSLPGQMDQLYRFSREGGIVSVNNTPVDGSVDTTS